MPIGTTTRELMVACCCSPWAVSGAMTDELPYAISKGAVHQMTRSLAAALAAQGITVNAINPTQSTRAGRRSGCESGYASRFRQGVGADRATSQRS